MTKNKKLVTHNGSFHADDVFATAALSIMLEGKGKSFKVIRTRDEKTVSGADYVYDVGGKYQPAKNRFDHHQAGFKEKRKNGIQYSSFGLIWRKFGAEICGSRKVSEYLDRILVEQIDATDNGMNIFKPSTTHVFNYDISAAVASFAPVWGGKRSPKFFKDAVKFAGKILQHEIHQFHALEKIKKLVQAEYKKSKNKKLLVLDVDIPRYLLKAATSEFKQLLFIVFKDEKNWKVFAVRKKAGAFGNRKDLPRSWAGLINEDLQKVTGVKDAIFCHRSLYLAVSKTKEGAVKLAQIAVQS